LSSGTPKACANSSTCSGNSISPPVQAVRTLPAAGASPCSTTARATYSSIDVKPYIATGRSARTSASTRSTVD